MNLNLSTLTLPLLRLALLVLLSAPTASHGQALITTLPEADQRVNVVARDGNTIYLGGEFTTVGRHTGSWAPVDATTGAFVPGFDSLYNGSVAAAVPDGAGGWYIAGDFTAVSGSIVRFGLAHILPSGMLDTGWDAAPDARLHSMALEGGILYVAGEFNTIGGQARNGLAALTASTGVVTSWDPNPNDFVYGITVSGTTVYAWGDFGQIGGQPRNLLAALSTTTGLATSWNPNPDGNPNDVKVNGTQVYVAGVFTNIGGQARNNIAAINAATGLATPWNPNANSDVLSISVSGTTVYAGGRFTTIGGQSRNYLAALDASTGAATTWNPNPDGSEGISLVVVSGGTVYAAGENFTIIGGQPRTNLAALSASTGLATSWGSGRVYGQPQSIVPSGSNVFLGGGSEFIGGISRRGLAAVDATTGEVTSWNPEVLQSSGTAWVTGIAVSGSTVYIGGRFTSVGGQTRNNLAAVDATTGVPTSWNPNASERIEAMALSGSTVYVAGQFGSIGGGIRPRLAAVSATTGLLTAWNPNILIGGNAGFASTIAVSGGTVYVTGIFDNIGGAARAGFAAVDATTGLATSWNPSLSGGGVSTFLVDGSTLYVGGAFTSIGGQSRNNIAALNASTGLATAWNPGSDDAVTKLSLVGSVLYAAGNFENIGGQPRYRLAALDITTGLARNWNVEGPVDGGSVISLQASGTAVYVGGDFRDLGEVRRYNFGGYPDVTTSAEPELAASIFDSYSFGPNPAERELTVRLSAKQAFRAQFEFVDISGTQLSTYSHAISAGQNEPIALRLPARNAGLYLLRVRNSDTGAPIRSDKVLTR